MKIHHIGYLVKKIERAIIKFEELGYKLENDIVYDEIRKVNICFLSKDGHMIELVSPQGEGSVVSKLLLKYKNMPYHICYATENFEDKISELNNNGYVQINNPCVAPAIDNKRVVFMQNPVIGLIELLEE